MHDESTRDSRLSQRDVNILSIDANAISTKVRRSAHLKITAMRIM